MPTGYTVGIEDGKISNLADFAMTCARAFGALISMRDDPMNAAIPDKIEPSSYYKDSLTKSKKELADLEARTDEDWEVAYKRYCDKQAAEYAERLAESDAVKCRYAKIKTEVEAWKPPSSDHIELKKFMLQQIEVSTIYEPTKPSEEPFNDWKNNEVMRTVQNIEISRKSLDEEIARANERSDWVKLLRQSLVTS